MWPVVAAAAAALLLAAAGLAALTHRGGDSGGARAPGSPPPYGSVEKISQAAWKIDFKPVGLGRLTAKERKRLSAQRPRLVALIKDVYGAMFLAPESLDRRIASTFIDPAARTFRRTKAGLPRGTERVRLTRRIARLAIDRSSPTRATARVRIVATGTARAGRFALEHVASLYMLRPGKAWKVIGFKVDQRPFRRPHADKQKPKQAKNRGDGARSARRRNGERRNRGDSRNRGDRR